MFIALSACIHPSHPFFTNRFRLHSAGHAVMPRKAKRRRINPSTSNRFEFSVDDSDGDTAITVINSRGQHQHHFSQDSGDNHPHIPLDDDSRFSFSAEDISLATFSVNQYSSDGRRLFHRDFITDTPTVRAESPIGPSHHWHSEAIDSSTDVDSAYPLITWDDDEVLPTAGDAPDTSGNYNSQVCAVLQTHYRLQLLTYQRSFRTLPW